MKTLFEQITHWKNIGEWEAIKLWVTKADTWERYYHIVKFINDHRDEYGYRYRDKILDSEEFKQQFGTQIDLAYLKKAQYTMGLKYPQ